MKRPCAVKLVQADVPLPQRYRARIGRLQKVGVNVVVAPRRRAGVHANGVDRIALVAIESSADKRRRRCDWRNQIALAHKRVAVPMSRNVYDIGIRTQPSHQLHPLIEHARRMRVMANHDCHLPLPRRLLQARIERRNHAVRDNRPSSIAHAADRHDIGIVEFVKRHELAVVDAQEMAQPVERGQLGVVFEVYAALAGIVVPKRLDTHRIGHDGIAEIFPIAIGGGRASVGQVAGNAHGR